MALPCQIYLLTGSPFHVGLIGLLQAIPLVIVAVCAWAFAIGAFGLMTEGVFALAPGSRLFTASLSSAVRNLGQVRAGAMAALRRQDQGATGPRCYLTVMTQYTP